MQLYSSKVDPQQSIDPSPNSLQSIDPSSCVSSAGVPSPDGAELLQPPSYNMGVKSRLFENCVLLEEGYPSSEVVGSSPGSDKEEEITPYHVGLDWLTVTTKDPNTATRLALVAKHLAKSYEGDYKVKSWGMSGYRGYICGPVAYGERHDSVVLQVTGSDAFAVWEDVRVLAKHLNITRFDLQVTTKRTGVNKAFFREIAEASQACADDPGRKGKPWLVWMIDSLSDKGDTVYVGSEKSEQRGRIYDKHKESNGEYPEGTVRYEVQLRREYAKKMFERLQGYSLMELDQAVTDNVATWFSERGVDLEIPANSVPALQVVRRKTDVDRSREWLRRQVKNTVRWLVCLGHADDVLKDLGLSEYKSRVSQEVIEKWQRLYEAAERPWDDNEHGPWRETFAEVDERSEGEKRRVEKLIEDLKVRMLSSDRESSYRSGVKYRYCYGFV